jgi:hypothetical protein
MRATTTILVMTLGIKEKEGSERRIFSLSDVFIKV